ncbi:ATP-binding protein, partial [Sesbania bispinosa]
VHRMLDLLEPPLEYEKTTTTIMTSQLHLELIPTLIVNNSIGGALCLVDQ